MLLFYYINLVKLIMAIGPEEHVRFSVASKNGKPLHKPREQNWGSRRRAERAGGAYCASPWCSSASRQNELGKKLRNKKGAGAALEPALLHCEPEPYHSDQVDKLDVQVSYANGIT
jgi:hypothetical protein